MKAKIGGSLAALLLLVSACGQSAPAVETIEFQPVTGEPSEVVGDTPAEVDRAAESTPEAVEPPPEPAEETCVIERIEDEYGFEVEISSCDAGADAVGRASFLTMDDYLGSSSARALLAGVRDRLILQSACAGGEIDGIQLTPGPFVRDATLAIPDSDVAEAVRELFAALIAADDVCMDRAAWTEATRVVFVAMQQLEELTTDDAGVLLTSREGELDDITLVTADATAHYDRLYFALAGVNPIEASDLWYSSNHLVHIRGLRQLVGAGQEPAIITMGSSVIARSVDPIIMSDQLGVTVMNGSLVRSSIPIQAQVLDQMLDIAETPKTIVWGEVSHRYFRGDCQLVELPNIEEPLALQQAAFTGIEALSDATPLDLIFGSDTSNPTYDATPILEQGEAQHGGWDRGYYPPMRTSHDDERMVELAEQYADPYVRPLVCEAVVAEAVAAVERWVAQGNTVIILAAPLSDVLANLHPLGRAGHDEVNDRLRTEFEQAGASFTDLSDLLDDGDFGDPTHANHLGRAKVTDALVELLRSG